MGIRSRAQGGEIGRLIGFVAALLLAVVALGQPVLAGVVAPENEGCLSAPRTTSLVARGSDVSADTIQSALRGADLQTTQGAVSLPRVQRYVDRILAGEVPPAIRVDGTTIVDGNHRYIASRIAGVDIDIQPWPGSSRPVVPWNDLVTDVADWAD